MTRAISIHALRGEGDRRSIISIKARLENFNPRPPWGGRHGGYKHFACDKVVFQSTPSVGRATILTAAKNQLGKISIHALRGEGDGLYTVKYQSAKNFNPRPPWGGRRITADMIQCAKLHFNPRPPWGGRPAVAEPIRIGTIISIHALRGEGDSATTERMLTDTNFNPRPPWGGRRRKGLAQESPKW